MKGRYLILRLIYAVLALIGIGLFWYAGWAMMWAAALSALGALSLAIYAGLVIGLVFTAVTDKYWLVAPLLLASLVSLAFMEESMIKKSTRDFCKNLDAECDVINHQYHCPSSSGFFGTERICNEFIDKDT